MQVNRQYNRTNLFMGGMMENLKVKVNNEAESKEAQWLFFELGYKWACGKKQNTAINECPTVIRGHDSGCMTWSIASESYYEHHKEITLPQLRDLVVLKRNDPKDANVIQEGDIACLYDLYMTSSKELYYFHCGKKKWLLSNLNQDEFYYKLLKPIEKPMKETLNGAEAARQKMKARNANEIADSALIHIKNRASAYDQQDGERSAAKTAKAFNAITGKNITESEVWLILQLLKDVRQWSREDYHQDSAEDCIAYAALKAESLERGNNP